MLQSRISVQEKNLDLPAAPHSVDLTRFSLQLRCAVPVGKHNGIIAPSGLQISLDLFLSRARPRRIVALQFAYCYDQEARKLYRGGRPRAVVPRRTYRTDPQWKRTANPYVTHNLRNASAC